MCQLAAAAGGGGGGGVYLPDYSVRQLTDLQIIKVAEINNRNEDTGSRKFSPPLLVNVHFLKLREKKGNVSQKKAPNCKLRI